MSSLTKRTTCTVPRHMQHMRVAGSVVTQPDCKLALCSVDVVVTSNNIRTTIPLSFVPPTPPPHLTGNGHTSKSLCRLTIGDGWLQIHGDAHANRPRAPGSAVLPCIGEGKNNCFCCACVEAIHRRWRGNGHPALHPHQRHQRF